MFHRHLSVHFRALDSKWGQPVDLNESDLSLPCTPAVVETSFTTFSSEEYLKTIKRRRKPCSCSQKESKRDSFLDISSPRIVLMEEINACAVQDPVRDLKRRANVLDDGMESDEVKNKKRRKGVTDVLKKLKANAIICIDRKLRKKC